MLPYLVIFCGSSTFNINLQLFSTNKLQSESQHISHTNQLLILSWAPPWKCFPQAPKQTSLKMIRVCVHTQSGATTCARQMKSLLGWGSLEQRQREVDDIDNNQTPAYIYMLAPNGP